MDYYFKVTRDKLTPLSAGTGFSGNANYYECVFDFTTSDWDECAKVAVFLGTAPYVQPIINGRCNFPNQILQTANNFFIGVYGVEITETGESRRISTNLMSFSLNDGALTPDTVPLQPEIWEQYAVAANNYATQAINAAREAAESAEDAADSKTAAENAAASAETYLSDALTAAETAVEAEQSAKRYALQADISKTEAILSQNRAAVSENNAENSANNAAESAREAEAIKNTFLNDLSDIRNSISAINNKAASFGGSWALQERISGVSAELNMDVLAPISCDKYVLKVGTRVIEEAASENTTFICAPEIFNQTDYPVTLTLQKTIEGTRVDIIKMQLIKQFENNYVTTGYLVIISH